jgi:hypothetical protein
MLSLQREPLQFHALVRGPAFAFFEARRQIVDEHGFLATARQPL